LGSTSGPAWTGGAVTDRAFCVLAPNPGPMTLDGTNTWVLSSPGDASVVVDPGPDHPGHLQVVLDRALSAGAPVREVLLTHGHADHSEGAAAFAALAGGTSGPVPVRALDPAFRLGEEGLAEGDVVALGDTELRVVGTPGHTADSMSFLLTEPGGAGLLTGDTVLGRGTTVVAHPDGRLGPYLDSLRRLRDLAEHVGGARVLPGHGPVLDDAYAAVVAYLRHRHTRLEQVSAALAAGDVTAMDVVRRVYADVDPVLWPAAELSVKAQLEYLRAD
jgi:glyoxylase-like metal-dependent hydrolase (beta-lactamase superfamily II)